MKSTERHKLKENEFARSVARARDVMETRGRDVGLIAVAVALVVVLIGGYVWWGQWRGGKAGGALGGGLARGGRGAGGPAGAREPDAGTPARDLPDRTGQAGCGASEVRGGRRPVP